MPKFERTTLMNQFKNKIQMQYPIIGGGAGTGLSAKCEEAGGIDLIIIYNSGRYRMAGRGSLAGLLAYGNANEIVKNMAQEVLPMVTYTPVLAGVNGTDPFCLFDSFLNELSDLGFSGVQNFPTVGLIDGVFRANLEETGMGYALEVDLIRLAHQKGLLTAPYVFDAEQAVAMTEAGADILVAHMGLTTGGAIGAETALSLEDCIQRIDAISEAALKVRSDILILCHGGPIATPADAQFVLRSCKNCHGFFGASSMERLPTEQAITAQTIAFKDISFKQKKTHLHAVHIKTRIPVAIDKIWGIMRNFNGLADFNPAIKASVIERGDHETIGSIRHLTLSEGYVKETLLRLDDQAYSFEYAIIEGTLPVENYRAGVRLSADGKQATICEWWADFDVINGADRNELIQIIGQQVFQTGFDSIAAHFAEACVEG